MKKTQLKDSVRAIKKTIVSWISIVIVTLIGCGVYFGVYFYADSLADNGEKFFNETNYEDFGIVATNGFTKSEIEKILGFKEITDAEGGYFFPNCYLSYNGSSEKNIENLKIGDIKVSSITDRISKTKLVEGRLPEAKNECALTQAQMEHCGLKLGDTVGIYESATELTRHILVYDFTITGVVEHGDAISENSSDYVYLNESAFDEDATFGCYTYVHVKADMPADIDYLGSEYEEALLPIKNSVREQLKPIAEEHNDFMKSTIRTGMESTFESAFDILGESVEKIASENKAATEEAEDISEKAETTLEQFSNTGYGMILRGEKESFQMFKEDVSIIHKLAIIFIAIFLVIGIIVILSTITIQIDNNRKYLGTMAAYGFRSGEIIRKYLIYGVSAVVVGMLVSIGLAAALQAVIGSVIGTMFSVKADSFSFFWITYAVMCVVEIVMAVATSVISTRVNVTSVSVIDLMNGVTKQKSDKKGVKNKKSGSLYSRLIMRNMKKDLGRVITSIAIIAGSCLMIGLGITLKGSLSQLMPSSREQITNYDLELSLATHFDADRMNYLKKTMDEGGVEYTTVRKDNTMYISGDTEEYLTVVRGNEDVFSDYINLKEWKGKGEHSMSENQVIIDNRLSERLNIGPGDKLTILDQGYVGHEVTVTGICKNYSGRLVYLSPDVYKKVFNNRINKDNVFLVRLGDITEEELDALVSILGEYFPDVKVTLTDRLPDKMDTVTRMFNVVVYLLIGLSIIMAVFVLLNLVNIFVKRRQNELIIMSVNGFRYKEQLWYMLKESIATTLLGLGFGVLIGWLMTDMVVRTVESSAIMHERSFNWIAWLIAVGLEALFAMLTYFFAFRKIRNLNLTDITK